ncbi:hypothetical protein HPP92_016924 [Vanilla planifolia]|uniref:Sec-independent protein translocase protein TATA, chloroplastic n=1 Tax=Vanilla planifolia TaxID=51239 RepID=A0A835QJ03_VANPL|nr:hypothetical protein HPP92_016924 [Vanilla planifolia]
MATSSLMASFSCLPTRHSDLPHAALLSSSSALFNRSVRSLSSPARLAVVARRERAVVGRGRSRGLNCRCLFGLGVPELVVIAGVAALVFGPKQLPEIGRSIGKTVKSFQQAAKEFETELKKEPEEGNQPLDTSSVEKPEASIEKSVASSSDDVKKSE